MSPYLLGLAVLCGGALLGAGVAQAADTVKAPVHMINNDGVGQEIGFITFSDGQDGLAIAVDLTGLPAGEHGLHIHEKGDCGPADQNGAPTAGMAAGGHYDPANTGSHKGPDSDKGHRGDLPKITANADGTVKMNLRAPHLKLDDIRGRSVMVHAGGDNYSDQPPMGGGGARIACGVIQ